MKVDVYVLHGHWETMDYRGEIVVNVSHDIGENVRLLNRIAESKAAEFCKLNEDRLEIEHSDTIFEMKDMEDGGFVGFYITEHQLELPELLMGAISREVEKIDRTNDIKEHLRGLYESENLEPWKYEYINAKPELIAEILEYFNKCEDCNISFNATLENAVEKFTKELVLDDEKLESLWEQFDDVLIDDEECLLDDFIGFECGTHREEVWHWFDAHHSKGVSFLMFGGEL